MNISKARQSFCARIERAAAFSVRSEAEIRSIITKENNTMKNKSTWQYPPVHPAAEKLPMMSDSAIDEMSADIKKDMTLHHPIIIWVDNREAANGSEGPFPEYTLDGRNRIEAMRRLGYTDPRDVYCPYPGLSGKCVRYVKAICKVGTAAPDLSKITEHWQTDVDPEAYIHTANIVRRHLTPQEKREWIAGYIERNPQASNREVGRMAKANHETVEAVRSEIRNGGNRQSESEHLPIERAKAAWRKNPELFIKDIAKIANVGVATAHKAKKQLIEAEEMTSEVKPSTKPEVELLRQAFEELDAPLPIFKKWVLEIHKLNVTPALLRGYLNELE